MTSAQVLPNSVASSRKQEHLQTGKHRVWIEFCVGFVAILAFMRLSVSSLGQNLVLEVLVLLNSFPIGLTRKIMLNFYV